MILGLTFRLFFHFWMPQEALPPANEKVLVFVRSVIGKKVDRGECWDLANAALTYANAEWTFPTTYGKPINYPKERLLPGDLMQIKGVTMESKTDTSVVRWRMQEHTAIVYDVLEGGGSQIKVAEQNVNKVRKVVISSWDLNWVVSGKIQYYRPQLKKS
jgi:hypothetical protein